MKIYLDDLRDPPDASWTIARTFDEFRELVDSDEPIGAISFDNDLGEGEMEGYDILKWLAEYRPELLVGEQDIEFHSANPKAVENMEAFLQSCRDHREDLLEQKNRPHPFGERE